MLLALADLELHSSVPPGDASDTAPRNSEEIVDSVWQRYGLRQGSSLAYTQQVSVDVGSISACCLLSFLLVISC